MNTIPETGRITLTLTTRTIKALRLLALLKGETQNNVAETLLIQGGLYGAVDSEWSAGKSETATPDLPSVSSDVPASLASDSIHLVQPTPSKPSIAGGMPVVPEDSGQRMTDEEWEAILG